MFEKVGGVGEEVERGERSIRVFPDDDKRFIRTEETLLQLAVSIRAALFFQT